MNSTPLLFVSPRLLSALRGFSYRLWTALVFFFLASSSATAAATTGPLTLAERAYVNAHPVLSVCVNPDWLPFAALNGNQQYIGIFSDLL